MADDIKSLTLKIKGDTQQARNELNAFLKDVKGLDSGIIGVGKSFGTFGAILGGLGVGAILGTLASGIRAVITQASEAERIQGKLNAMLKVTGESAGLTAAELDTMAEALAHSTQFDDKQIKEAMTVLLAFPGVGRQTFSEALRLATDLSVVMGGDLSGAARNVGRALQDPVNGLRTLKTELGINIVALGDHNAALIRSGDTLGAQKNVIAELESRLGGVAAGANTGLSAATTGAAKSWDELLKTIGRTPEFSAGAQRSLTTLTGIMDALNAAVKEHNEAFLRSVNALPPQRLAEPKKFGGTDESTMAAMMAVSRLPKIHALTPEEVAARNQIAKDNLKLVEADLKAQSKLVKDELDRQSAELDRQLALNLVSYRDYYARRMALQQGAIDQEIKTTEAALGQERATLPLTAKDEDKIPILVKIKELEADLIILRQRRADAAIKADAEELQAGLKLLDQVDQVRERLLTARGDTAAAKRSAIEREFRDLVGRLEALGDKEGVAIVTRLLNVETAKAQLDQIRIEYDRVLAQMQITEQDVNAQRDAGLLGEIQSRRKIVALHKDTNAQLAEMIPKMQAAAAAAGPEAQQQVEQLAAAWKRMGEEIDPVAQQINTAMETDLANSLEGFINQTMTASQAFTAFAKSVIRDLERIAAQKMAESIFQGFNMGAAGTAIASLFHAGGLVGGGGMSRAVSALAFAGAPRFHAGGISGLRPDEVPAILQTGERVLSRDQLRNGAGPGNVKVQIDNKGTPQEVSDSQVTFDPDAMVVSIVLKDLARGGPVSGGLARAFNLRRS